MRICADHARAAAFLINDGVLPANDGRGYVLRKIMRRAMRNARMIGMQEAFLYKMTTFVAEYMKPAYPELMESADRVARVVRDEEQRYSSTFQVAERVFQDEAKTAVGGVLPGASAFRLYDTFGLALDEQEDMARDFGLAIDREGFETEMSRQRERARASWKGAERSQIAPVYSEILSAGRTVFLGYDGTTIETCTVRALILDGELTDAVPAGVRAELVLDQTPFYAESGGQVGDTGFLSLRGQRVATVANTFAAVPGLTVHRITTEAPIQTGDLLTADVASAARRSTMRNHTATHLLHAALRSVLGSHVKQAGSVVEPARLRFDFSHYTQVTPDELREIERIVNEQILANIDVSTDLMPIEQALATGAMALFGEKYGDTVRVVSVPGFSRELCGGTHVCRTGDIGQCKIVNEGSISAGVRRIEAVTGEGALRRFQDTAATVQRIAGLLRGSEENAAEQLERFLSQQRSLEREVEQLRSKLVQARAADVEHSARDLKGVRVVSVRLDGLNRQQLRELADSLRNKWKTAVVVLATAEDSKVSIVSAVTKDLTGKIHAGKLAGQVAAAVGGKGGGRPDMAEAGGSNPTALNPALERVYSAVEDLL
jgi:alanyl-tRNA synthetase